jgi:hypothetical protein
MCRVGCEVQATCSTAHTLVFLDLWLPGGVAEHYSYIISSSQLVDTSMCETLHFKPVACEA